MKKSLLTLGLVACVAFAVSAHAGEKKKKNKAKAKTEQTDKKEGCSAEKSCCSKKPAEKPKAEEKKD